MLFNVVDAIKLLPLWMMKSMKTMGLKSMLIGMFNFCLLPQNEITDEF